MPNTEVVGFDVVPAEFVANGNGLDEVVAVDNVCGAGRFVVAVPNDTVELVGFVNVDPKVKAVVD